jgi:hypothetical protein
VVFSILLSVRRAMISARIAASRDRNEGKVLILNTSNSDCAFSTFSLKKKMTCCLDMSRPMPNDLSFKRNNAQ